MSGHKQHSSAADDWTQDLPQGSLFRSAFESSRTVMFLIDPDTAKIVAANRAACDFYGYDPAEVSGVAATDVSLLDNESLRHLLRQINAGGSVHFSSRHRLKDGDIRDMELDAAPITLKSGRSCLFFIGHDVTARREAEEALRRSEGLLRAILDAAVDGIGYKDAEGVYREANQAFCRMVGKPCEEIIGREGGDFFDRRAASRHVEMDRRTLAQGTPVAYELVQERSGERLCLSVHKSPVYDAEGRCLGVVSVSHDITARRKAEDALKKSEGLLRAMLHSAQDTIFVTDEADVLRELNQAFCEQQCRSRKVLLGKHLSQVFNGDELRIQLSTSALARETREPVSFTQHLRTDDQQRWVSVVKNAVLDAEGKCLGVVAMGRDITAQHLAEQALRQSERRLSGLIRQAPVGVFETDAKGLLVFANERMQRQTGRTEQALSGNGWIESIVAEDRQEFLPLWLEALEHKREVDRELRFIDARGVRQWMSCRIRPMTDAANRFSGFLGVIGDISERKKAEALRTDVESVVRHDLKSPLGSVQNAMELLELMGPLSREQAQVVGEVRILTRRMQDLISLSLDLHAMEAGAFKPSLTPVDLCEVVEAQRLELRTLLEGKGIKVSLVSACQQGPFYVKGERRLLDAVFSNLLKNAAEASPEGGEITVRLENEGPLAEIFIRNRGEVPRTIRERFFEKYATAGKPHGTGIGTYSARLMARTMGGTLSLNTEEPGCTTLILRLPSGDPAGEDLLAQPVCPAGPEA